MSFVHLHVHGPFSSMDGVSSPTALAAEAARAGMEALALTDRDTLAGAASFLQACRAHNLRAILGADVTLADGGRLILLAPDHHGYAALCRLLTQAHLEHPRGQPAVSRQGLETEGRHLLALSGGRTGPVEQAILSRQMDQALDRATYYRDLFGRDRFFFELPADRLPGNRPLIRMLRELGEHLGVDAVASGDVRYATKGEAWVHDLLVCARLGCDLETVDQERIFNAERYLKSPAEVLDATGDARACSMTAEVAAYCATPLELGIRRYPDFPHQGDAIEQLRHEVEAGARWRYGQPTEKVRQRLRHELDIIAHLGFADYFLCVWDVARWARRSGIRVAGRGSAADSAVAYVLGITDVDAAARGHLFERFLSEERAEAPDIDLDFDARFRDRVAEYVVERYGRQRVAAVAAYNTFGLRSAVRTLGRVLGFPPEELAQVSQRIPYYIPAGELQSALERVPELASLPIARQRLAPLTQATAAVSGLPRHLATHLGGLCITPGPVTDLMPVQRSAKGVIVAQFDKRDLEALGLLKLDLLSLRTLGAVDDAVRLSSVDYERIPEDDPETYARLRRGETMGVFQLESPAQRALQVRLGTNQLEDVIASVALVRPGPIKGNMVDPFVHRRRGREPVTYPHPDLEGILQRTFGVVVYQEQVIAIASAIAGFTPGEADRLRRVMSHARSPREMEDIGGLFRQRAIERGVDPAVARDVFACLEGYASYGFPEAHAVAFGMTAYRTAYLATHHPAPYFAGLLNNQPMGFYPVHTLVTELRRRGVSVHGPDIQHSQRQWDMEPTSGLRAPLTAIRNLPTVFADAVVAEREAHGPYRDLLDLCRRIHGPLDAFEGLVLAGACDGLNEGGRRRMLWSLPAHLQLAHTGGLPLGLEMGQEGQGDFSVREQWLQEASLLGFSPRGHLMELLREDLEEHGYLRTGQVRCAPHGLPLWVAGIPVRPHRPPTRSGQRLVFLSLEDEEGLVEVMVPEKVYQDCGPVLFPPAPVLGIDGHVRRRGQGMSLIANRVWAVGRSASIR